MASQGSAKRAMNVTATRSIPRRWCAESFHSIGVFALCSALLKVNTAYVTWRRLNLEFWKVTLSSSDGAESHLGSPPMRCQAALHPPRQVAHEFASGQNHCQDRQRR